MSTVQSLIKSHLTCFLKTRLGSPFISSPQVVMLILVGFKAIELWRGKQVYSDVIDEIKANAIYGKKGNRKKDNPPSVLNTK